MPAWKIARAVRCGSLVAWLTRLASRSPVRCLVLPCQADLLEYKQQVIEGYEAAEDACDALLYVLEQEDLCQSLKESGNWTPEYLATHHEVDAACIDAFFRCAKYKYECGEWDPAAKYLHDYAYVAPRHRRCWLLARRADVLATTRGF